MARRNVNLRMDDEPRESWREVTSKEGVSLTALIDALGYELKRNPRLIPRRVYEQARELDDQRRSR